MSANRFKPSCAVQQRKSEAVLLHGLGFSGTLPSCEQQCHKLATLAVSPWQHGGGLSQRANQRHTCMVLCFAACSATCSMLRDQSEKRLSYSCAPHASGYGARAAAGSWSYPACKMEDLGTPTGRDESHLKVMLVVFVVFSHPCGEGAARIGLLAQGQADQRGLAADSAQAIGADQAALPTCACSNVTESRTSDEDAPCSNALTQASSSANLDMLFACLKWTLSQPVAALVCLYGHPQLGNDAGTTRELTVYANFASLD